MLVTLAEILKDAEKHGYAVMAPDFPNIQVANSLLRCAEMHGAPLALSFSPFLKPATGVQDYPHFIRIIREFASQASIPVALHLDHAYLLDDIQEAIDLGFTSVMIDASSEPWDVNLSRTQEVVKIAHAAGVSVESELGHVASGSKYLTDDKSQALMTNPEQAAEFVRLTGIDALAVAIGTVHGEYHGEPHLDFERLQKLDAAANIPLVLHGSSGTGENNLRKTIELGIRKINVYSDLMKAIQEEMAKVLMDETASPIDIAHAQHKAVCAIMDQYLALSGSIGAANHWQTSIKNRIKDLFLQGYMCSEAIFLAFAEKEGYASDITQKFASLLGGGICNHGKTCGAILGGLAVIGARESNVHAFNKQERRLARQTATALLTFFESKYHTSECFEMIHLDLNIPEEANQYKEGSAVWDTCLPAMFQVADWLEKNNH